MPKKPPRLEPGDTVALIAPASAPPDPKAIDKSVKKIESMGFKVRLGRNARARWGYLAGKENLRAKDINAAFADKKVKGIFCVRGGYGTAHLLRTIDYNIIRENPKVFVGYSDITSLHCAFLKKANLVTFHGPMWASDFIKKETPDYAVDHFLRAIGAGKTAQHLRRL
jgi:muramoyltetrapeptide carboxypeptidase